MSTKKVTHRLPCSPPAPSASFANDVDHMPGVARMPPSGIGVRQGAPLQAACAGRVCGDVGTVVLSLSPSLHASLPLVHHHQPLLSNSTSRHPAQVKHLPPLFAPARANPPLACSPSAQAPLPLPLGLVAPCLS